MCTWTIVLLACHLGKEWKRALAYMDFMIASGLRPNAIHYTALITTCYKSWKPMAGLQVFTDMRQAGHAPDVVAWNAVIGGFAKTGQVEMAYRLLQQMQVCGAGGGVFSKGRGGGGHCFIVSPLCKPSAVLQVLPWVGP